ncbi:transporter [Flavobacterium sp. RSB2_4_14]|uniref:transporter n=1 Tax=Flavobacterium sp. RSB2_4_14 TaxID=3447665 RepID=UPI003F3EFC0F
MKNYIKFVNMRTNNFSIALVIVMLCVSISTMAQGDGARFYWKNLMGTNGVPVIASSMSGNSNPFDPSRFVIPGSTFEATMTMAGYAKMLPLFKRSAMVSVIMPMGRLSSDVSLNGLDYSMTARGFGDPMLMLTVNLIGAKPQMNIPDAIRYQPKFSLDVLASLAVPIGEYDSSVPINLGQNRWYGRIGTPIVWQIGPWVPGKRTTLEFLPAVWLFSDNTDYVGKTMQTEPMFQLEGHLTRDFMERLWGSLDVISYSGGKATIDGVEGNQLSNVGVGGTLGYHINDNMQLNLSYSSTVDDNNTTDLKMDSFRVTLIYGWHSLIEGMNRLSGK